MDITERKITKIAREAEKLVLYSLRENGVGTAEIDLIHAHGERKISKRKAILSEKRIKPTSAAGLFIPPKRRKRSNRRKPK